MAINRRDPRLQRALLAARGRPSKSALGLSGAATAEFAGQQADLLNEFGALANQRRVFDLAMAHKNKQLAWSKRAFNQQRKDVRDQMRLGLIGGIANLGVAAAIGYDRKKKTAALAKQQQEFTDLQTEWYKKQLGRA